MKKGPGKPEAGILLRKPADLREGEEERKSFIHEICMRKKKTKRLGGLFFRCRERRRKKKGKGHQPNLSASLRSRGKSQGRIPALIFRMAAMGREEEGGKHFAQKWRNKHDGRKKVR